MSIEKLIEDMTFDELSEAANLSDKVYYKLLQVAAKYMKAKKEMPDGLHEYITAIVIEVFEHIAENPDAFKSEKK